jgi:hypothetical protein
MRLTSFTKASLGTVPVPPLMAGDAIIKCHTLFIYGCPEQVIAVVDN